MKTAKRGLRNITVWVTIVILSLSCLMTAPCRTLAAVDKGSLGDLITQAEALDVSAYGQETVDLLQAAITTATEVYRDETASLDEVNRQIRLLEVTSQALIQREDDNTIYSGTYEITGIMRSASSNNASMGNAALQQPMKVLVDGSSATLHMEFARLTSSLGSQSLTGYLARLSYYPGWEGGNTGVQSPSGQTPVAATVLEYHEGVYDSYNDPNTGSDNSIKGQLYPKWVSLPMDLGDEEIWLQIYVPVMEGIAVGSGTQYARLQLDWSTLNQISGADADKTQVQQQLDILDSLRSGTDYTLAELNILEAAIVAGEYTVTSQNVGQSAADAVTTALKTVVAVLTDTQLEDDENSSQVTEVNKQGLWELLLSAVNLAGRENLYTADSIQELNQAITQAQTVYNDSETTQEKVNAQLTALSAAMRNLVAKETTSDSSTGGSGDDGESNLDVKNLEDGIYKATGTMLKIDKTTTSMADEAINHTIKLTVKNGKYKITMDFQGLEINSQFGYLSKIKYYRTGYSLDSYGSPTGSLKAVTVDTYQEDSSGNRISDSFGTDYPNQVTFALIKEALEDGYVPLQVYVPIMESISAGTGTQPVFLKLDWATLELTESGDSDFEDNNNTGSTTADSAKTGTNALLNSGSSLPSGSSLTSGNSSLNGSSSLTGSTGLSASSAADTTEGKVLSSALELGTDTTDGGVYAEQSSGTFSGISKSAGDSFNGAVAAPAAISCLAGISGVLYKLKSRRIRLFGRKG